MKRVSLFAALLLSSAVARADAGHSFNFRFSPIGALAGIVDVGLDYKVTPNVVVGAGVSLMNVTISDVTVKGSGYGVRGNYHFEGAFTDGWYVGAQLGSSTVEVSAKNSVGEKRTADASATSFGIGGGYHWFWDSFNLNLGAILGSSSVSEVEIKDTNGTVVERVTVPSASLGLQFLMGFTF